MWLASAPKRNNRGGIVTTDTWTEGRLAIGGQILTRTLRGLGDRGRGWRLFRMQVTLCLHVACSEAELLRLPSD